MQRFLESVASYYLKRSSDLGRTWLVVPNKRSGMYLRYYLKIATKRPLIMPRIITLGSFINLITGSRFEEADRLEQIFTLYRAHTSVRIENGLDIKPFDSFLFWGEIMLDDFEDIDLNLADADAVLKNVSDFREIETDYLTDEQVEVAREIWGYDLKSRGEGFWRHINHDNPIDNTFYSLWNVLIPTYHRFHEDLASRNLTTRGALARKAAEISAEVSRVDLNVDHIGFIGFDILNGSTKAIFRNLGRLGIADYFWDEPLSLSRDLPSDSKAFIPLKNYIRRLKRDFPMPSDFILNDSESKPEITVYAVPSGSLQAKLTGTILDNLIADGLMDKDRPDSTAVVLPAPALLTTLLHSLPDEEKMSLNITMGLPVRHTPFATFMSGIVKMYLRATEMKEGISFLNVDIEQILNHPSILLLGSEDATKLKAFLTRYRRINVPIELLRENAGSLSFLFQDLSGRGKNIKDIGALFDEIIDSMVALLEPFVSSGKESPEKLHEIKLLKAYKEAIGSIVSTSLRFASYPEMDGLAFDTRTFIILLEKILRRETLNMSGAPMRGMQIMGPLETRSLDFDNIIMLSVNERTFPKKTFFKSLIPHSLRVGYGLTTVEDSELQYAWIFFNLISRSRRAVFMYDARQGKIGSNEMSRYLFQLKHIFTNLSVINVPLNIEALKNDRDKIAILKTEPVKNELRRFLAGGDRKLSASSIRTYLECPLRFYLSCVKRLSDDVKPTEYIDSATIGTVVHAVLEDFYSHLKGKTIYPGDLENWVNPVLIKSSVATKLNNKYFNGRYADNLQNLPGEAALLVEILGEKIVEVLRNESRLRSEAFSYNAGEYKPETDDNIIEWQLTDDLTIRFTYSIDRIDRLADGTLRFIDYKTGHDTTTVSSVEEIFGTNEKKAAGALFQILAYAHCYAATNPGVRDITPEILKIFESETSLTKTLAIVNGQGPKKRLEITSYRDIPNFQAMLADRLRPLFDDHTPLEQTVNEKNCEYCQFRSLCDKLDNDNS